MKQAAQSEERQGFQQGPGVGAKGRKRPNGGRKILREAENRGLGHIRGRRYKRAIPKII